MLGFEVRKNNADLRLEVLPPEMVAVREAYSFLSHKTIMQIYTYSIFPLTSETSGLFLGI